MLTANALRPGGIYENMGAFDLYPFLSTLTMKDAPTSTATNQKLQLMQTPASAIPDSGVKTLIALGEIPASLRRPSMARALAEMELVVACGLLPWCKVGFRAPKPLLDRFFWGTHCFWGWPPTTAYLPRAVCAVGWGSAFGDGLGHWCWGFGPLRLAKNFPPWGKGAGAPIPVY